MTLRARIEAALTTQVANRPVFVVGRVPRNMDGLLPLLRKLGAGPILRVSLRSGAGHRVPDLHEHVLLPGEADPDFVLDVARLEAILAAPGPGLARRVSELDPEGRGLLIAASHVRCDGLLGRRRLGPRSPMALALEDKTRIPELWHRLGLPRTPHRVVPVEPAALASAAAELDRGHGTVWAGDNHTAMEGGAIATRWVHDGPSRAAALGILRTRCRTARVMPFLPGIPVSIHAWILPRGVAVLSPMEMVVLRSRTQGAFRFCGVATTWRPEEDATATIRDFAQRVARHLHGAGYRGALSVDGVLGPEGFLPTELNARFPAGLSRLARHTDGLPLALLDALLRADAAPDLSPAALQAVLRAVFERHPLAWLHATTPRPPSTAHGIPLHWTGKAFRRARTGEPASSTLSWEPAGTRGALRLDLPAPPRGTTGAALLLGAVRAAGPPLSGQLAGWEAVRMPG